MNGLLKNEPRIEVQVNVSLKSFTYALEIIQEYSPLTTFCVSQHQLKIYSNLNSSIIVIDAKTQSIKAKKFWLDDFNKIQEEPLRNFEVIQFTVNVNNLLKKLGACIKSKTISLMVYNNNTVYIRSLVSDQKNQSRIGTDISLNFEDTMNEYIEICRYISPHPFEVSEDLEVLLGFLKSTENCKFIKGLISSDRLVFSTVSEKMTVTHTSIKRVENSDPEVDGLKDVNTVGFKIQKDNLTKLKGLKKKLTDLKVIMAIDPEQGQSPYGLVFVPQINPKYDIGKIAILCSFDMVVIDESWKKSCNQIQDNDETQDDSDLFEEVQDPSEIQDPEDDEDF